MGCVGNGDIRVPRIGDIIVYAESGIQKIVRVAERIIQELFICNPILVVSELHVCHQ